MIYMLRDGFAEKLKAYVEAGGQVVMTYWSAVVNEADLCFLGGVPGEGLRKVFGVWEEESQSYYPNEKISVNISDNSYGFKGSYEAVDTCSIIHPEGAEVLATYGDDYFADTPALTVNQFGKGKAYYMAARMQDDFLTMFYKTIADSLSIKRVMDTDIPNGVVTQMRTDGDNDFVFVSNFNRDKAKLQLDQSYTDLLTDSPLEGEIQLEKYEVKFLKRQSKK